jgi:uncharacterized protein YcfJ
MLRSVVLGVSLLLGAASGAWAEGNVAPKPAAQEKIEVIVVTAKRPPAEIIDEVIVVAKRPGRDAAVRTPPVMPIELPQLDLAIAAPPVVRL